KWNFGKFVIGRDGKILQRFDSKAKPESQEVTGAIESALAVK
ncbi:MAG: Glutathione peroxidase, partial [Pedosphaera sp.]|nr:Glutathione peroxidase [Pedosphaera sp.]